MMKGLLSVWGGNINNIFVFKNELKYIASHSALLDAAYDSPSHGGESEE